MTKKVVSNGEKIDCFVFFRNYWELMELIPNKEQRLELYEAIIEYALNGNEPDDLIKPALYVWNSIKPHLAKSRANAINGRRGGAKPGNQNAKKNRPPTFEELADYIWEHSLNVNPHPFFEYFEGKDWKWSDKSVKDWRQMLAVWHTKGTAPREKQ